MSTTDSATDSLFAAAPAPLLLYSLPDQRILAANDALLRLLGWTEQEIIGQALSDFIDPQQWQTANLALSAQAGNSASLPRRWRQKHRDGHVLELEISSRPVDWQGQAARLALIENVSEREQNRRQLENYHEQLESLVEQRTAALLAARQDADAARRAQGIFLSRMSHELRTPLNAILGFSRLLADAPETTANARQQLELIENAGKQLLQQINEILEVSRLEAGMLEKQEAPFALDELLRDIGAMSARQASTQNLDFHLDLAPDLPPWVSGDENRLRRVLLNLLANALQYTTAGAIRLTVARCPAGVCFSIADTGPCIPAAEREQAFQAFYQGSGGERNEGGGLGLHLAREYARLMGGELVFADDPPWHCLLRLSLPLPAVSTPEQPAPLPRLATASAAPIRVLLVDDQYDSRWLAEQLLLAAGCEVRTAENGQQAIDAFLADAPQLIWMDMRMPVLDGAEATRRIRRLPGGNAVRIAAMTGNVLPEERATALAAGCDAVVGKPLDPDEVLRVMQELLALEFKLPPPPPPATGAADMPDLSVLPGEKRAALAQAAETLDLAACREISRTLANGWPEIARGIDTLLAAFRFDRLAECCAAADQAANQMADRQ